VSTSTENNFSKINDSYKLHEGEEIKIVHHLQDLDILEKKHTICPV
jgi:hypothetical protein